VTSPLPSYASSLRPPITLIYLSSIIIYNDKVKENTSSYSTSRLIFTVFFFAFPCLSGTLLVVTASSFGYGSIARHLASHDVALRSILFRIYLSVLAGHFMF
jgi:hypothetical protein